MSTKQRDEANHTNRQSPAYRDKDEYDKAIADFNKAIELNPNFTAAIHSRGFTIALRQTEKTKEHEIEHPYQLLQIIHLTFLATLILSPIWWIARMINRHRDRIWALKEDSDQDRTLTQMIDSELESEQLVKCFSARRNSDIILKNPTKKK